LLQDSREATQLTKNLEVISFKTDCLIHVLQQSPGRSYEDIHPRQAIAFILQILPADYQAGREGMMTAYRAKDIEYLDGLGASKKSVVRTVSRARTDQFASG
jgi:hypothetical protein